MKLELNTLIEHQFLVKFGYLYALGTSLFLLEGLGEGSPIVSE